MDSGSVVPCSKRLKSFEDKDIISKLPDYIIAHILSLLPVEDAVRTCVLSQKWMKLWTLIADLRFRDTEYNTKQRFLNLVNRVMLRLNDSGIHSFTLVISNYYDPSHVHEWISAALHRRVKQLHIERVISYSEQTFQSNHNGPTLSYSLLQFQTLDKLKLMVDYSFIRVPSSASLSSLTVLELFNVTFLPIAYSSHSEDQVILKFPVLRKYKAIKCTWSNLIKTVTFEMPLLQVLTIKGRDFLWCLSSVYESHPVMKFRASHLTEFNFEGPSILVPVLLEPTTNLASVDISLFRFAAQSVQEVGMLACKLLKQFGDSVKSLKFEVRIKIAKELPKDSLLDIPTFRMLSHLKLQCDVAAELLLSFLLKTPFLKTLIFMSLLPFGEELLNSASVPDCFRSNLQVVKFGSFIGSEHEMNFAKFVMENAQVLEKIGFRYFDNLYHSKLDVKEKLFSFKKASGVTIIEL